MRYIILNDDNIVISWRQSAIEIATEGEIQSDAGEIGQQMLENGTFIDVEQPYIEPLPTLEDKVDALQDDVDYLILKQEGVI